VDDKEVIVITDTVLRHPTIKDVLGDIKSRTRRVVDVLVFVDSRGQEIKNSSTYFLV